VFKLSYLYFPINNSLIRKGKQSNIKGSHNMVLRKLLKQKYYTFLQTLEVGQSKISTKM